MSTELVVSEVDLRRVRPDHSEPRGHVRHALRDRVVVAEYAARRDLLRRAGAHVPLPTGPGLGITLDEAVARAHPLQPRTGWRTRGI